MQKVKKEKFSLENLSQLSKGKMEREEEITGKLKQLPRLSKKAIEREKEITEKLKTLPKGGLKKELSSDVKDKETLEELRAIERQKIKEEGGKLRKKIISGGGAAEDVDKKFDFSDIDAEKAEEEILEITPDMIIEEIAIPNNDLDKDFTKLEKEWFAKEPEEKKEILENNEKSVELVYRNQLDRLHLQDPKKYPSGEEYMESSDTLEFFDQRKQQIELELQNKFGYNILEGGFWAQYKAAKKLDPDDNEKFKKLIRAHKNTDKSYRERLKKHIKKFSEALNLVSPRSKGLTAERGRHPELGAPKLY